MTYVDGCDQWRASFLRALRCVGEAAARLPYGVSDPVVCGNSAIALYTGGLWPSADLELLAAEPLPLRAELLVLGFCPVGRLSRGEGGLWHGGLQFCINIVADPGALRAAGHANAVRVALDAEGAAPLCAPVSMLRLIGIEDLIADQIASWLAQGARPGEASALIQVLVELGRAGVGGQFRGAYLRRRLAHDTNGAAVFDLSPAASALDDHFLRVISLTGMAEVVRNWRMRRGLSFDADGPSSDRSSVDMATRPATHRNDKTGRPGGGRGAPAQIVPFPRV